ncbi:MAG: hypothetical protein FJ012_02175 [Chloroflexi bacterium]|nr:hypothetical protein [Chloroflexota bacterium]
MATESVVLSTADTEAIRHFKKAMCTGKHWYIALLEAIELWNSTEEVHQEEHYRYLIGHEAFDWLSLAQRLCSEVDGLLPEEEKINLLFFAAPPIDISPEEFSKLIGSTKYRAYLNYLYGVVVEEALLAVAEEAVYKERRHFATYQDEHIQQEAYRRVYGTDMITLLNRFRQERGYPLRDSITLTEQKEFTYWLFRYRLDHCDKARIASDTKEALKWLRRQWDSRLKRKPARL